GRRNEGGVVAAQRALRGGLVLRPAGVVRDRTADGDRRHRGDRHCEPSLSAARMHGLSLWLAVEPPAYLLLHVSSLACLVRRITSLLASSAARPDEPVCTA